MSSSNQLTLGGFAVRQTHVGHHDGMFPWWCDLAAAPLIMTCK
nr:MAG TPA: hypothetical protein [Caudoviricetes sp.]